MRNTRVIVILKWNNDGAEYAWVCRLKMYVRTN